MKKIVIAFFILSITAFAAIKGSLWYLTEQFVVNQVVQAKPFAQISYKEINTSFSGSATVNGVKVYIPVVDDSIFIDSIQFSTADLLSFLTLNYQLEQKQLPESLSLLISGAKIDLSGNLMTMMDNPDIPPSKLDLFSTLACGDVYRIGSKALIKMGYDKIVSDITLNYQFNPDKKLINYTMKHHLQGMTSINLSGDIHGIRNLNSFFRNTAKPGKIKLEINDDTYIERKNNYCAQQENIKVDEYISKNTRLLQEYLKSFGVIAEGELLNAYKTVLETSGLIAFEADLSQLSGTKELISFSPNDIIQFIRLKLFINGVAINEISIAIDKDKLIETVTSDHTKLETSAEIKKQVFIIRKYRPVNAYDLNEFFGFRVKLETKKGKQYKGIVKKTKNSRIYEIETHMRSGNISYFIPVDRIKKAEVYYSDVDDQ